MTIPADESAWPEQALRELGDAMRWAMPREFGGDDLEPLELHLRYEQLARRSLSLALILTQRDSAVGIIAASENVKTRRRLLDEIRAGAFVTVGIAQLTTSRQGATPALAATMDGDGYRLNGLIPWATGAEQAKFIIAGAVTNAGNGAITCAVADGDSSTALGAGQILFPLRTDSPGVTIDPPMPLVALAGTCTTSVRCENVSIARADVLIGPAPAALSLRGKSVPIPQAFLALGHCRAALDLIAEHRSDRAAALRDRFAEQIDALHARVIAVCRPGVDASSVPQLRGECNDLALRITHAAVALYKGTALLLSHPAQRLAREAMFLLVWSCPDPVIDCTVDILSERTT